MMEPETHIIQKQVLELHATSNLSGTSWQRRAFEFVDNVINPVLNAYFARLNTYGVHVEINKLEFDLGTFRADVFEKEAYAKFESQLRDRLDRIDYEWQHHLGSANQDGTIDNDQMSDDYRSACIIRDVPSALFDAFFYFLRHGVMPWWYHTSHNGTLESTFTTEWFTLQPQHYYRHVKGLLQHAPRVVIRLVNNFSTRWIASALDNLGMRGYVGETYLEWFTESMKPILKSRSIVHQNFWYTWIRFESSGFPFVVKEFVLLVSQKVNVKVEEIISVLKEHCAQVNETSGSADVVAGRNQNNIAREVMESLESFSVNELDMPRQLIRDYDVPAPNKNQSISASQPTRKASSQGEDRGTNGTNDIQTNRREISDAGKADVSLFVPAAGLVLVHPFIKELFTLLGLWNNNAWSDDYAAYRAVKVLSFLAYGESDMDEHWLPFQKILCGVGVYDPLEACAGLQSEEKDRCSELLSAVINHWKSLKNTSSDGLREGFLQREGKLFTVDNGFKLQVESRTEDVLLSHIPWGFGMIRLPWMKKMIHVDWI